VLVSSLSLLNLRFEAPSPWTCLSKTARVWVMERDLTETRNACTPFGGLPEELLIQIAVHLIHSDTQSFDQLRDWVRVLISICHRIRGIFEATPELWVHVSLSWEAPCIDKFLFCAAAHPLRIQLDCAKLREPVTEPMLGLVYNARSLVTSCSYPEMYPPERHLPTFFASLRNLGSGMPSLHTLTIREDWWNDGTMDDWHLLHVAHPHLTSLTLTSVQVRGRLLPLPQLQSLELSFTMIQPDVLRNFLIQSRMLRIVRLLHPLLGYMPLVETRAPHGTTLSEKREHGSEHRPSINLMQPDGILVKPSGSLLPARNLLVDNTSICILQVRAAAHAGSKVNSVSSRRGRALHVLIRVVHRRNMVARVAIAEKVVFLMAMKWLRFTSMPFTRSSVMCSTSS
jgi:hypothetical protein